MREENLLMLARLYVKERQRILRDFATSGNDIYLENIKDAMAEEAPLEYRTAIITYLNAIIGGEKRHNKLIKTFCGKELFQKLLDAGLNKIR